MNRPQLLVSVIALVLGLLASCTWTRFDDVMNNPPVERLETPSNAPGIGLSMATFSGASGTELAVTSVDKLVLYALGSGTSPTRDALVVQSCAGDSSCVLAKQLAGLRPMPLFDGLGCVAYGLGTSTDTDGTMSGQLLLHCEDLQRHTLPVPDAFRTWLSGHPLTNKTQVTLSTTRRGDVQPLAAAVQDASAIWFYDGVDSAPVDLPSLPDNQVAGRSLAVIDDSAGYLIAAGSVTTDDNVWLYRVTGNRIASLVGCIHGLPQFGRLLTTGQFDDDKIDDLAVSDEQGVTIIRGSGLAALAELGDTTCGPIDSSQVLGQAQCPRVSVLDGCGIQPFAASLASGNLDDVGTDELLVGVPNTSVGGESSAGAVFVYSMSNSSVRTVQGLYVSTATSGDALGTSVAIAHVSDIDMVVAGAPGSNSVMAFYCNSLMPTQSKSARCP